MLLKPSIFDITKEPRMYEGIQRFEFKAYDPENPSKINSTGDIKINTSKDAMLFPAHSYLVFEGKLTKAADGTAYAAGDKITLVNNAIPFLFKSIRYQLSDKDIEEISTPGQATTMFNYLTKPRGFAKAQGLMQLWCKDTEKAEAADTNWGFKVRQDYIIESPDNKGSFQVIYPLKDLFGFCDDYSKVVYGFKHSLILTRANDNDAIHRDAAVGAGKITLSKITWMMPHVTADITESVPFLKIVEDKVPIPLYFRSRRCESFSVPIAKSFKWNIGTNNAPNFPRYIIVGFQTDLDNSQTKNTAIFNHVNVTSISVRINSSKYPDEDYNISFPNNQFARVYRDAATFSSVFYNMNELVTDPSIAVTEYRDICPLFAFDVSKYEQVKKVSQADVKLEVEFSANPPANTQVYALIISDCIGSFKSNGTELSLVK